MELKQSEKNKTTGEGRKLLEGSIQQTFRQIVSLALIAAVIFGLWALLSK